MKNKGFTDADVPDQSGRTIMITGANTGLGYEAARVLATCGARVLMACRSADKAGVAMDKIRQSAPNADLNFVALDQADLSSVESAAKTVSEQEARLDVLINNAGIMVPARELTKDGFESQMGVNHFGSFALTALLLGKLAESDSSRVVVTSSIAHKGARIEWNDLSAESSYNAFRRYKTSKLANLIFMHELDRRLKKSNSSVRAVGCHPGIAATDLARHMGALTQLAFPMTRVLFNSSLQGAWPTLLAATRPGIRGGEYFGPAHRMESAGPATSARASAQSRSPELGQRLWDASVKATGIDPEI